MTPKQKAERLAWCISHYNFDFTKHIFVDETSIFLKALPLYHMRKKAAYPKAIPYTVKYRQKLHLWAGISVLGSTPFQVVFNEKFLKLN